VNRNFSQCSIFTYELFDKVFAEILVNEIKLINSVKIMKKLDLIRN